MAATKNVQDKQKEDAKAPAEASANNSALGDSPDGFIELSISRRFFKPEVCVKDGKQLDIQGYLLGTEVINSPAYGATPVLLIRLTKPTLLCDDNDALIEGKPGDDAIIVATHKLEKLIKFAEDPNVVGEVLIRPIKKSKLKNGHDMWEYKAFMGKLPRPRHEVMAEMIEGFTPALLEKAADAASSS